MHSSFSPGIGYLTIYGHRRARGIADRIIEIGSAESELLEALYDGAHALLFPSRFEGFGWPIAEAQACGCPVLCRGAAPMSEVAGGVALLRDIADEDGFAKDLLRLRDPATREKYRERGLQNARRFSAPIAPNGVYRPKIIAASAM